MYYIAITIIYVYTYNILCAYIYIYIITQTVVTTAFCKFIRKSSDLARPQLQTSPSPPRRPPVFLAKSCRSLTSVRRNRKCKRRNFSRVNIFSVLVYTANSAMPLIVRFFRSFFSLSLFLLFFFEDRRKANESHRAGQ